jgi:hypothetical protein
VGPTPLTAGSKAMGVPDAALYQAKAGGLDRVSCFALATTA